MVQDYLTVYDGGSTSDKVLVRLCGGDAVPDIVSSHNTMLLEFHTSPYDNPFHPVPLSFLPGFELEVQVIPNRLLIILLPVTKSLPSQSHRWFKGAVRRREIPEFC